MMARDQLNLKWVGPDDIMAVKNYVREIYLENEPIHKHLFSNECKNFRYFDRGSSIPDCINVGASYMYTTETGEIVAVGLVGCNISSPSGTHCDTPIQKKLKFIFRLIEDQMKVLTNVKETDKEASFWILSVHPDWIGRGLAESLMEEVMTLVKFLGFTHIRSFCTSDDNTKLFEKFGFTKLYSVRYVDFDRDGKVIFPEGPDINLNFMHREL